MATQQATWPTDQNKQEANQASQHNQDGFNDDPRTSTDPLNPNPSAVTKPDKNPNKVDHAQLHPNENRNEGGKEMGLVKPPITSLHPTSSSQTEDDEPEFRMIDNANFKIQHYMHSAAHTEFRYPLEDMEPGQGMFIPLAKGKTTDSLMSEMHRIVDAYRKQNSEVEKDENGDDVMEDVAINVKKRNDDGTVQLDGGVPRLTVRSGFRPKLIGPSFTVKAVVKGDKLANDDSEEADTDGVLIVRMS